jgi:hypothetical protein
MTPTTTLVSESNDTRSELLRIVRISDMLITGHSNLRDSFKKRGLILDCLVIASSVWLTATVFIEPQLGLSLTPFHLNPQIWIGLLSVVTLFLSVVQLRVDWKGRADAHQRSAELYSRVKSSARRLIQLASPITSEMAKETLSQYDLSSDLGCAIPESEFVRQKKKHLTKIMISRLLDRNPGASISILRAIIWWRGNVNSFRNPLP